MKHKRTRITDVLKPKRKRKFSEKQAAWQRLRNYRSTAIMFLAAEYMYGSSFSRVYIPPLVKGWLEEMPELALDDQCRDDLKNIIMFSEREAARSHHLDARRDAEPQPLVEADRGGPVQGGGGRAAGGSASA